MVPEGSGSRPRGLSGSSGHEVFYRLGVPQSYAEAMNWSLKAAKQGNPSAQAILGTIYESGYGVPQNFILAYMWFTVSAHDPDFEPGTRRNLDGIARHLAPAQIAAAKSLAQQCLQTSYLDCTQAPQVARRDDDAAASTTPDRNPSSRTRVPLRIDRGVSFVPVEINRHSKVGFCHRQRGFRCQRAGRCLFYIEAYEYGQRGRSYRATIVRFS